MDAILEEDEENYSFRTERRQTTIREQKTMNSELEHRQSLSEKKDSQLPSEDEGFPEIVRGINIKSSLKKVISMNSDVNRGHTIEVLKSYEDREFERASPKDVRRHRPKRKTEYTENLIKISEGYKVGNEYDTLKSVIANHELMAKKKLKKAEWFVIAQEEWEKTETFYLQTVEGSKILQENHGKLEKEYQESIDLQSQLENDLTTIKDDIVDARIDLDSKRQMYEELIEAAECQHEELSSEKLEKLEYYSEKHRKMKEKEERWKMQNEDFRNTLMTLRKQREKVEAELNIIQEAMHKIEYHRNLQRQQSEEILVLSNLLRQVAEYASEAQDIQFFESFAKTTHELKQYTYQTIEGYQQFVEQATTDPKTILPFTRTSKPLRN